MARKPIDVAAAEHYAGMGAPDEDIADMLEVPVQSLARRCRKQLRKARARLRTKLRRAQMETGLAGNATLLTWLGRHELHQTDKNGQGPEPVKGYVGIDVEAV